MTKIHYEPHPCAPERKAELRAQGFKIVDARFDPAPKVEAVKRTRKPDRPEA